MRTNRDKAEYGEWINRGVGEPASDCRRIDPKTGEVIEVLPAKRKPLEKKMKEAGDRAAKSVKRFVNPVHLTEK